MTIDGPPSRHLHPVEPPFDPEYDAPTPGGGGPGGPGGPEDHNPTRTAERAVLATLIQYPATGNDLAHELDTDDFDHPHHRTIWDTWHHLNATLDTPPDHLLLNTHLIRAKATAPIRLLTDLVTLNVNPAHATRYAADVRDAARLRAIEHVGADLRTLAAQGRIDQADQQLTKALDTIETAFKRFGPRATGTTQWAPLNLDAVLAGDEVDPPPALLARTDDALLLYAGAVHTISGEPGSGKTWLTLIAAVQELAHGHHVTMVDFEDRASRVVGRLLALGATPTQIRELFHYVRPHTALDATSRTDLEHATRGSTLVILDGVTEAMTLHGLDLNANADVANFYALLPRTIADHTGAAVVMIDHVVKDGEKQGRWGIGGQHKLAGIDGVAYLVKAIDPFGRGKIGHARMAVAKDRPGYVEELALGRTVAELHLDATDVNCLRYHLDPPAAIAKDEAGNMRPTHLMERVSRYIEITPGLGKNDLLDGRISGKKIYLRRAIDRLLQEGYIEVAVADNRKQIHRSITPYREDEDAMHSTPGWGEQEALS